MIRLLAAAGMLFLGFGAVFNAKLMGEGYPSMTLWAPSIALAVNVALNLWLIPKLGLRVPPYLLRSRMRCGAC